MYWGISIVACVFHILDRFWWQGKVLQLALVTPYLSDHYALFNNFADDLPAAYNILLSLALGVQVFWEVALLPLMYWKWGARFRRYTRIWVLFMFTHFSEFGVFAIF